MKSRRVIWIILPFTVVAIAAYWFGRPEKFGVYQGKDAWQWARQYYSPDQKARDEAAAALNQMGSNAVPMLLTKLRAKPSISRSFRVWLGAKLPDRMGRALTKNLEPVSFEGIHSIAAHGLLAVSTNAGAAVPALIKAMRGTVLQMTWDAAGALGAIGESAVLDLIPLLDDSRPSVRHAAVYALGQIGPPALAAVPALICCLNDRDPSVQASARDTLGRIGLIAGPAALKAVQENRGEARRAAARAVVAIHPRGVLSLPALGEMAHDLDAKSRAAAIDAMAELRITHTNALAIYRNALSDSNALVRTASARALGNLFWKTEADVPALAAMQTNDSDESVRAAAQRAVENILAFATNHSTKL